MRTGLGLYILDGHTPVACDDTRVWGPFMRDVEARRVDRTKVNGYDVSTMFLGTDHRFIGDGPPILFETMIFGGRLDLSQWRFCTWHEAEVGHAVAVELAKHAGPTNPMAPRKRVIG